MKRIATFLIWTTLGGAPLYAMPSQITFQGTLKQQGAPVNTTKNMQFSFVDASGATIPGTSPISIANVQVTNGLFAVQLPIDPSIPWEQYSPFIRVLEEGQILAPDQPLNANLYAVSAIPQGMVAIFANTCPLGWSEVTNLRGRFPVGADPSNPNQFNIGETGGALTHNHTAGQNSFIGYGPYCSEFAMQGYGGGCGAIGADSSHGHTISSASSLPPYLTVVFCQKL